MPGKFGNLSEINTKTYQMRKLIYSINVTLDGTCDHTKALAPDPEAYGYYTAFMREGGTLLYGRVTYQLMVPFWPDRAKADSGDAFAKAFDAVPNRVVFSRTLKSVDDPKATIVRGDLREEVMKLKQQEGKPILAGGVDLASQLMALDLIDEYRIVVQPVLVGQGRRLLEGIALPEKLRLELVETKLLSKGGFVALHYVRNR